MKKFISVLLIAMITLSLCACEASDYASAMSAFDNGNYEKARELFAELGDYEDSEDMVKTCDYHIACELMDDDEYGRAVELFDTLEDYKDSEQKAEECRTMEIDELLQGKWKVVLDSIIVTYEFDNGRFNAGMTVGTASIDNVGDYRIDTDNKEIYVCYDYIISTSGKTPNTEEQLLFTYDYNGSKIVLTNSSGDIVEKE